MQNTFNQYKKTNYADIAAEVQAHWEKEGIFARSVKERKENGKGDYVFYEGPPSANGKPGIHHVLSRSIKDTFCRYKALQGYAVDRRAGWDTHGLPVELGVEKELGIKKEDIGKKLSIEEYNDHCKKTVMRYRELWEELTEKIGFWVNMDEAYVTYKSKYMETVWWLLKKFYEKGLLYKGHTVQPYSPAAGTGLSSHELNQPGCYRDVKDVSAIAQFSLEQTSREKLLNEIGLENNSDDIFVLAWTTTPWTLPANTALACGKKVSYALVESVNRYTAKKVRLILAETRLNAYFKSELEADSFEGIDEKKRHQHYRLIKTLFGEKLVGLKYEQLIPYVKPEGKAFEILEGDFVSDSDGTGIVHLAPCYGADDARVCKQNNIAAIDIVDATGRYTDEVGPLSGAAVKDAYEEPEILEQSDYKPLDVRIAIYLKENNKAFLTEKYEHSYPHCWRTDKPILYFPLESWFVKTTEVKDRMLELNKAINWQPQSTGTGRFGNWLENLVDWNLSRSRFWGIPLPIWRTEDGSEEIVIGSVGELKSEIDRSIEAGHMASNFLADFNPDDMSEENYDLVDIHRTYVDPVILVSKSGAPMRRESDIIDVWFDSGSMPYAQLHYPFENKDQFGKNFPADFIAEGVDQTRGWFFTLHAIATIAMDGVAFKNVVSNGLVLDKNGQKMSKSKGNTVEPFEALKKYGADPVRWYILNNAQPWDNLKFDVAGIEEVQRKFFGTLQNTYGFFALYANLDGFTGSESTTAIASRPVLDRWILSELNTTIEKTQESFENYNPTVASRLISEFVTDRLSNWYVRLNRKRFWKGELNEDKLAAYQTLHECLVKVAILAAPIAPMYMDRLYCDLMAPTKKGKDSVHMDLYPEIQTNVIDATLEEEMSLAQELTSLVLSLRERANIRVRQPLQKILVPVLDENQKARIKSVEHFVLQESNIKEIVFLDPENSILKKKVKPNFKTLGPKFGKQMGMVSKSIGKMSDQQLATVSAQGRVELPLQDGVCEILKDDLLLSFDEVAGLLIDNSENLAAALDVEISEPLKYEGISRELINRIQNLRKESGFEVTDRIEVSFSSDAEIKKTLELHADKIAEETLADKVALEESLEKGVALVFEHVDSQVQVKRV